MRLEIILFEINGLNTRCEVSTFGIQFPCLLLHDNIVSVREWHTDHNDAAPKPIFKINALAATHHMKIEGTFPLF